MVVFKSTHQGQGTLFVKVDLNKQLIPGSFEFALNHIVNTLDISCFDPSYQNEDFKKKKEGLEKFARKLMGYNGLAAADSAHQIIAVANAVGSGPESEFFPEMLNLIEASMKMIIEKEDPLKNKIVLADTGYFSRSKGGYKWQAKYSFCRDCPMRDRCISSRGGKKSFRTLHISRVVQ